MTGAELRKLERDLQGDLVDTDRAVRERVREAVRSFLLSEAALLAGSPVRDEQKILDLIQLHVRVNLLQAIVSNPKGYPLKEQRELFKSLSEDRGKLPEGTNPMDLIASLQDVSGKDKKELIDGVMALARQRLEQRGK